MRNNGPRVEAKRREPSFGRVFAAVWGGILVTVLVIALTSGGSAWWVIAETATCLIAVAVILYELSLLLDDEENDEEQAPAPAMAPSVVNPRAVKRQQIDTGGDSRTRPIPWRNEVRAGECSIGLGMNLNRRRLTLSPRGGPRVLDA
ncbi:hypothetical protein AB0L40_19550 [Patulibacter sp. NPDC049589]|uniref:hypothetical protein n=1 Tax=Patulibacter sp. NPDC049589 TaxID=3154731 RepID=UPI00343C3CE1